jgi:hypothetical protein
MIKAEQFDLLNVPVVESPRLKWLKEHDVRTRYVAWNEDDDCSWAAWVGDVEHNDESNTMLEKTEHDAIVALALKYGWRLWNETI